jgi:hypothetical protein
MIATPNTAQIVLSDDKSPMSVSPSHPACAAVHLQQCSACSIPRVRVTRHLEQLSSKSAATTNLQERQHEGSFRHDNKQGNTRVPAQAQQILHHTAGSDTSSQQANPAPLITWTPADDCQLCSSSKHRCQAVKADSPNPPHFQRTQHLLPFEHNQSSDSCAWPQE